MKGVAVEFDGAELAQMLGDELGVEQTEAARDQPRAQEHQRHLAGIARVGKHALAEKGAVERHAVEPADQAAADPGLHRVAVAGVEQIAVKAANAAVDPGGAPARAGHGTAVDHAFEVVIDPDLVAALADRARQALGDVHRIERQNAPLLRLNPIKGRVVATLGHGEYAASVGLQEDLRGDLNDNVVARSHQGDPGTAVVLANYGFCRKLSSQWMS